MPAPTAKRLNPAERLLWSAVMAAVMGSITNKRKPHKAITARLAAEYASAAVDELRRVSK